MPPLPPPEIDLRGRGCYRASSRRRGHRSSSPESGVLLSEWPFEERLADFSRQLRMTVAIIDFDQQPVVVACRSNSPEDIDEVEVALPEREESPGAVLPVLQVDVREPIAVLADEMGGVAPAPARCAVSGQKRIRDSAIRVSRLSGVSTSVPRCGWYVATRPAFPRCRRTDRGPRRDARSHRRADPHPLSAAADHEPARAEGRRQFGGAGDLRDLLLQDFVEHEVRACVDAYDRQPRLGKQVPKPPGSSTNSSRLPSNTSVPVKPAAAMSRNASAVDPAVM